MKTADYRVDLGTRSVPVRFIRNRKARRYILRLLPCGTARVTIPRGGSSKDGAEFAHKNKSWLEKQLRRTQPEWQDGTEIFFRGVLTPIRLSQTETGWSASVGEITISLRSTSDFRAHIEAHLRGVASDELRARAFELAREHQLEIRAVSVRNQRSRWGSCSARRTICLNWRLIQTPPLVRDYIIVHELMHLHEMNHSPRFWAHVQEAFPIYREAERWLKSNGGLLR